MTILGAGNDAGEQVHSSRRTLAVLETIAAHPRGVTPKGISQALKIHLSTCYRLLNTLLAAGYVVRSPNGLFSLGRRVAYLNHRYEAAIRPRPEVLAFLHALQLATQETAALCRLEDGDVVITATVEGSRPDAHPGEYVGLAGPAYAFAVGRVLLAGLPAARREVALSLSQAAPGLPGLPRVSLQALRDEMVSIQQKGYAVDRGDSASGVCCYAAPIRDGSGVTAAVGVIGPCARLRCDEERMLPVLLEVARAISALLTALPEQETGSPSAEQAGRTVSQAAVEAAQAAIADAMSRVI
ncbi:MAG: IclR family transcriptional regulator [Thermomicrobiales bacterium]|nr:IclR family transcriptional regulator [Thermomicrobiales bacterium]